MDMTKIIQILSEAIDDKDWDVIKELLEDLIYEEENPIQHYEKDNDLDENLWGWHGIRLVLFDTKVQRSLSTTYQKRLTNLIGDESLDGLVIDWHLAEYDYSTMVAPIQDQPTYAYTA